MGLAAKTLGAKLLFDMRGFWVDERIEGGYWAPGSAQVRLGRWAERRLLRDADHIVLLTERARGRLNDLAHGVTASCTVVPTCVDLDRFVLPPDRDAARRALGLGPGPVLIHTGTLTGWYDGDATMAVARRFIDAVGGTFVILTRDLDQARALTARAGIPATVATAAPDEVPLWLQAADAGLAMVRVSPAKDASFPTKVGEYLAAGLAVLATPVGDMEGMADGTVLAVVDPTGDLGAGAAWLARASMAPGRATRARALAEASLGLDEGVQALARVYRDLGITPEGVT